MTITIPLGRNARYGTLEVEEERFSEEVREHIWVYGLRQILNDAIADKKDDNGKELPSDQIVAKALCRLDNLYIGAVRRERGVGNYVDERTLFILNLTKDALTKKWRQAGTFGPFPKGTKNRFLFAANKNQVKAGKETFESEVEFLNAILAASPKSREKFERLADEVLVDDDLEV